MDQNLKYYDNSFYENQLTWKADYILIADWISKNIVGKIFGDIGCGDAHIIAELQKKHGRIVWGVDGSESFLKFTEAHIREFLTCVDLTEPTLLPPADVAMCMEVAEHIDFKFSDILVENIVSTNAKTILFTAAPPGQDGTNHINLQPPEFWIRKFIDKGYALDLFKSGKFKKDMNSKLLHTPWYLNNFMVFRSLDQPSLQLLGFKLVNWAYRLTR